MNTPPPPEGAVGQRLLAHLVRWRGLVAVLAGLASLIFISGAALVDGNRPQAQAGDVALALIAAATVYILLTLVERQEQVYQDLLGQLRDERDKTTALFQELTEESDTIRDLNERLNAMNRELGDLSRAKSEFMARMSHELRTPLNSIVGYSELVLDGVYGELTDRQRDRLERILRNGRNLLGLINDILDLSRIDAGHLELTFSNVRVAEAIRLAVASMEPMAQAKGLPIVIRIDGNPPNIRADELRLRQMVCNLLDNAIKFTEHGRISVWAGHVRVRGLDDARFPQLGHGDWLVVRVSDTGIGIDPALHQTIFEDFAQADTSSTRLYEGGGLGLAITRRLATLHGGAIWVDSLPGEGATFTFGIPYTNVIEHAPALSDAELDAAREQPLVLAVDDEADALEILDTYLSQGGYKVARASGGEQALEAAALLRPDVITLDILMPDLDGWLVLERLRANPLTAAIPVVMVSIVDQKPRALQMGAVNHVCKPIDRNTLLSAVAEAVESRPRLPILIVDDNPNDRNIFSAVLHMAGHRVATAESEEAAITWLQGQRAGLVLVDLERDEIDDLKVLGFMRQHTPTVQTPALVIWPKDLSEETRHLLRAKHTWVLKKHGLAQETLLESVASALGTLPEGDGRLESPIEPQN